MFVALWGLGAPSPYNRQFLLFRGNGWASRHTYRALRLIVMLPFATIPLPQSSPSRSIASIHPSFAQTNVVFRVHKSSRNTCRRLHNHDFCVEWISDANAFHQCFSYCTDHNDEFTFFIICRGLARQAPTVVRRNSSCIFVSSRPMTIFRSG